MGRTEAAIIALGEPTFGTVFNADDPKRSPANTLAVGNNIKIEDGNLRGFKAPGAIDPTAGLSTAPVMYYVDGLGWLYSQRRTSLCHDSVCPWGAAGRFSYRATEWIGGAHTPPVASDGSGNNRKIGINPPVPTNLAVAAGGMRQVRLTVVAKMGGLDRNGWALPQTDFYNYPATGESNPQQTNSGLGTAAAANSPWLEISAWDGAVITIAALGAAANELALNDGSAVAFEIRAYARPIGATAGPAKFIGRADILNPLAASSITLSAAKEAAEGTDLILSWDVGGAPENPIYKQDFSPCPDTVHVVSDDVHTVAATGGGTSALVPMSAGILVAVTYDGFLCWSDLGYPTRWPISNRVRLEGFPNAVVTNQAITYLSTTQAWYILSGTDSDNMGLTRAEAEHFVPRLFGGSVATTPIGVMFCHELGVVVFTGAQTQLLRKLVHPETERQFVVSRLNYSCWHGLYNEGYYMADIGGAATIVVDLTSEGKDVTFLYYSVGGFPNTSGLTVRRLHSSKILPGPSGSSSLPSLWATLGVDWGPLTGLPADGPHSWRPRIDGSLSNSLTQWLSWQARSQALRAGVDGLRKKWRRLEQRVFNSTNPAVGTFSAVAGRGDLPTSVLGPIALADGLCQLPFGFDWVDWIQFYWDSGSDASNLQTSNRQVDALILKGETYVAR